MSARPADDVALRMREDWERRARENARLYIADKESEGIAFTLSGCRDAFNLLEELHPWLRADMRVLEIGCGIGRMVQFLAVIFAEVHGLDVAPAMIEQARRFLARFDNVRLHVGSGRALDGIADESLDLVVSHAVFQHVPELAVVSDYVRETRRVLVPGGLFKLLVKTAPWEGQRQHDTWCGIEVGRADLERWVERDGWELVRAYTAHDPATAWVVLRVPQGERRAGE